jgi:hypothetical protein
VTEKRIVTRVNGIAHLPVQGVVCLSTTTQHACSDNASTHGGKPLRLKPAVLLALLIGGSGPMASPAMADIIQGPYVIEATFPRAPSHYLYDYIGCLVAGKDGESETPSLYDWGVGPNLCNQPDGPISKTAIWDIYMLTSPAPERKSAYVIRSRVNGKCLIRGSSGTASNVTLYRWPSSSDTRFCGHPSVGALIANGQAAWNFDIKQTTADRLGRQIFEVVMSMPAPTLTYLDMAPIPIIRPVTSAADVFTLFSPTPSDWKLRLRTLTQYP